MEQAGRIAPEAKPPTLLGAALICLSDGCPPEAGMQMCGMIEDDEDGDTCRRCWEAYLYWVANGRRGDPYRSDRLHEGGMVG